MQLTFVNPVSAATIRPAALPQPVAAPGMSALPTFLPGRELGAPGASASTAGAIDGVSRLFDFPGLAAGDAFDIVKGSKVGFIGVKGSADILRFENDAAAFNVRASAFGKKVDVTVEVVRTGADTVRITSRGSGMDDQAADGRIIASRTNYAEFSELSDPSKRTVISFDGRGRVSINTVVPTFGNAHLLLDKRA